MSNPPKLVELGALIDQQLPAICTFVFFRTILVRFFGVLVRIIHTRLCVAFPETLTCVANGCLYGAKVIGSVRNAVLLVSLVGLAINGLIVPPEESCVQYDAPQAIGVSAGIALIAIVTSNSLLASGLAICTLKAVSGISAASIMLAATTAFVCIEDRLGFAFFMPVVLLCIFYTLSCYSPTHAELTHGTTLAATLLIFYYIMHISCMLLYRIVRIHRLVLEQLVSRAHTTQVISQPPVSSCAQSTSLEVSNVSRSVRGDAEPVEVTRDRLRRRNR